MEKPRFLSLNDLEQIKTDFGTPSFVYDEKTLKENLLSDKQQKILLKKTVNQVEKVS